MFLSAIDYTLRWEGIYSADPDDPGGETVFGISRRHWPDWPGWVRVDMLRDSADWPDVLRDDPAIRTLVQAFYRATFWAPIRGDDLPERVAIKLFDLAVNLGIREASRILQHALNLLNRTGQSWEELAEDGIIGPRTLSATRRCVAMGDEHLINLLCVLAGKYYVELAEHSPRLERYIRGWIRRALAKPE